MSDKAGQDGTKDKEFINIKCVSQGALTENEVLFRVKLNTAMRKVMKSYSERSGVPESNLRFLFDGRRILEDQTPKLLGFEDGDVIEVYQEQTGGH
ncbi:small ubiquitin-related modifier-like [Lineus longissimus]|uniref:small ubiquitin-related modifier-like n=1 Tax=Lineus longissimus TaxID=88925 RepID=UPI002B4D22FB